MQKKNIIKLDLFFKNRFKKKLKKKDENDKNVMDVD